MNYSFKTKSGRTISLNFGNYFLKMLSRNKGVDYTKATTGLLTTFGALFTLKDGKQEYNPDSELTPFIDELVYVVQAGLQAHNAAKGIFNHSYTIDSVIDWYHKNRPTLTEDEIKKSISEVNDKIRKDFDGATPSLEQLEYILLEDIGDMKAMFTVYGEIVNAVVESISPEGLGKGDKQKKSVAAKRK